MSLFDDDDDTLQTHHEKEQTVEKQAAYNPKEVEDYIFSDFGYSSKICCLLYGKDGTAKSGIVLDYIKQNDLKADEKIIVIDLDGGCEPIALTHHTKHFLNTKQLIIKNPIVESINDNGDMDIDYIATMNNIKKILVYLKNNIKKHKIKAICLDGLSTLLKYCEYQTRSDKHIAPDGGMQLRYWINRMRFFITIIEVAKSLPCDRFFIAHEDFNVDENDEKKSSVVRKTNQMMFQKILCVAKKRKGLKEFTATIDKSKSNVNSEGKTYVVLSVPEDNNAKWDTTELYKQLRG